MLAPGIIFKIIRALIGPPGVISATKGTVIGSPHLNYKSELRCDRFRDAGWLKGLELERKMR